MEQPQIAPAVRQWNVEVLVCFGGILEKPWMMLKHHYMARARALCASQLRLEPRFLGGEFLWNVRGRIDDRGIQHDPREVAPREHVVIRTEAPHVLRDTCRCWCVSHVVVARDIVERY